MPIVLWLAAPAIVAPRIRALAAERRLTAEWSRLNVGLPASVAIDDLLLRSPLGDTVLVAGEARGSVSLMSLLAFDPRPTSITVRGLTLDVNALRPPGADTIEVAAAKAETRGGDRLGAIRRNAERFVDALTRRPSELPRITLERVVVVSGGDDPTETSRLELDHAVLDHHGRRTVMRARGTLALDSRTPFFGEAEESRDGTVRGRLRLALPASNGQAGGPVELTLDGKLERRGKGLSLLPGSRVTMGRARAAFDTDLEARGPKLRMALEAKAIDPDSLRHSLPPAALGPLRELDLRGTFDYELRLRLDLAQPESVAVHADVVPHGLALAGADRLGLTRLDQPFTAQIHLPRRRVALRELSAMNSHFLPLHAMDPVLVHAVVTNEDGGFFRHRGFNTEAVEDAIAENLRAGAFRRGAGTITMQLVRNLYLGHERTVARKAQEVVLAWIVEHLTGVSKERLLEIYLNIIEWGPNLHGADEAALFYFGRGAERLTVSEALFLATVIPAPSKWKWRFDSNARLRSYVKDQMHFIGRAMVAKGWLDPSRLPPREELDVQLRGPALEAFPKRAPQTAPPDTVGNGILAARVPS